MVEKDGVVAIIGGSNPLLNGQLNRLLWELDVPLLTSVDNFGGDGSHLDFFPRAQLFEAVVDLFRWVSQMLLLASGVLDTGNGTESS